MAVLIMGGPSPAFADLCEKARKDLDESVKAYLQQNRDHWKSTGEALYAMYREKIDGELNALNRETRARLKTARGESERGVIRSNHHEWYAEIWQLRKTEDCRYGESRLRQLLLWISELMEKNRREGPVHEGYSLGTRG